MAWLILICIISGGSVTALSQRGWAGNRVFCRDIFAYLVARAEARVTLVGRKGVIE